MKRTKLFIALTVSAAISQKMTLATTELFVLVVPYITSDSDLLAVVVPLKLGARGLDDLTALPEKGDQISLPCLLPLFFGERNVVCDGVHLHKKELRPGDAVNRIHFSYSQDGFSVDQKIVEIILHIDFNNVQVYNEQC